MKPTLYVDDRIRDLWAMLAGIAAQRAVNKMRDWGHVNDAEECAKVATRWLTKAGARAAQRHFNLPR